MTLTTPLSGQFVRDRLGHAMINLTTKFELSNFTRHGNMKGIANVENRVVWGG